MRQAFNIAEFTLSCTGLPAAAQQEAICDGEMLQLKLEWKRKSGTAAVNEGSASNLGALQQGNQYELKLLASLTLVIVPQNNEIVFKVRHDRHNNHFRFAARTGGSLRGNTWNVWKINTRNH